MSVVQRRLARWTAGLTPGVWVAPAFAEALDTDETLDADETAAYARRVTSKLGLEAGQQAVPLALTKPRGAHRPHAGHRLGRTVLGLTIAVNGVGGLTG